MTTKAVQRRDGCDVYIGRPSKWGNPFTVEKYGREECLRRYNAWIFDPEQRTLRAAARLELRGKRLGCYCAPKACHGDTLARIAESTDDAAFGIRVRS